MPGGPAPPTKAKPAPAPKPKPAVKPKPKSKPAVKPKQAEKVVDDGSTKETTTTRADVSAEVTAVLERLKPLEAQYVQDALDDWIEDNEGVVPEGNPDWEREKASILTEFDETVRQPALARACREDAASCAPTPSNVDTGADAPTTPSGNESVFPEGEKVQDESTSLTSTAKPDDTVVVTPAAQEISSEGVDKVVGEPINEQPPPEAAANETVTETIVDKLATPAVPAGPLPTRGKPLTRQDWEGSFDSDGRFIGSEWAVKSTVFKGGVEPDCRSSVWPFLFGVHDFQTTSRERLVLQTERRMQYLALKERLKETLNEDVAEISLPGEELDDEQQFEYIQAKVNAMRHEIDEEKAEAAIRTIGKDVPRTDRKGGYFTDDQPHRLQWLSDILVTFAVFHPEVGYAQGMNDILSMILTVMDHEADAYWCFKFYMLSVEKDFQMQGMMDHIERLKDLHRTMDPVLHKHFEACDAGDMVFAHRWLLLRFKREFPIDESIRLFEILASHHLETSSLEADKLRSNEMRALGTEVELDGSQKSEGGSEEDDDFKFELFICLAIIRQNRTQLLESRDMGDVVAHINSLTGSLHLDSILLIAEQIFGEFCRQSVGGQSELQRLLSE